MSRTDVHRPWRVQAVDPYNRHRVRRHEPYSGRPNVRPLPIEWFYTPLYQICGCDLCTCRTTHRYGYRQERAAWRAVTRELLKALPGEHDLVDMNVSCSVAWPW